LREAVGDLLCGLSVYDRYEIELTLRELKKTFDLKSAELASLLRAFEGEDVAATTLSIDAALANIARDRLALEEEIEGVDGVAVAAQNAQFLASRADALKAISKANSSTKRLTDSIEAIELETSELEGFVGYLEETAAKLPKAERTADVVGAMEFTHCPACLKPLKDPEDKDHCVVCGTPVDPEREQSRYLQLRLDLEFQLRESKQLLEDKSEQRGQLMSAKREADRLLRKLLTDFSSNYELHSSPREVYLARRHQQLGALDNQEGQLQKLRERALKIEGLSAEKADLQGKITKLSDRLSALTTQGKLRRSKALTAVSSTAASILRRDWQALQRQAEFQDPRVVALKFADNAITVDDEMNFAESSNVIVKNAAILALLISASTDTDFYHPRFALFDNVEDKGMEPRRSHNFQKIISDLSAAAPLPHQVIVTTSMMNPELESKGLTVGPYYTHERKTLQLA